MKRMLGAVIVAAALAAVPAGTAFAGGEAHGRVIQEECGVSFGYLVANGGLNGVRDHANYAGGAQAFTGVLAAHGCGAG